MTSSETIQNAMQRKMAAIDAVLDEQDEQFDRGIFDANRLAEVSLRAGAAHGIIQRALEAAAADKACVDAHVRPTVQIRSALLRRMSSNTISSESMPVRRGSGSSVESETSKSTFASISQGLARNTAEQSTI